MLDTQYRMHPVSRTGLEPRTSRPDQAPGRPATRTFEPYPGQAIAALPSDLFYGGRLASGVTADARPAPMGFDWPDRTRPVALLPSNPHPTTLHP